MRCLHACSESGTYYAPSEGSLEELKEYTRQLPVEDPPETFGLHPNADITFQQVLQLAVIMSNIMLNAVFNQSLRLFGLGGGAYTTPPLGAQG